MSDIAATPATTRACSVEHEESSSGSSTPLKQVSSQTANGSPKLPASDVAASQETEKHPKGKRKRTSAADKAILEAAYLANPKPDKQARLDLVARVSMNEKEVQIWFQNRRQNDRRRTQPLSPQDIEALAYSRMHMVPSSDTTAYTSPVSAERLDASASQHRSPDGLPVSPSILRSNGPVTDASDDVDRSSLHAHNTPSPQFATPTTSAGPPPQPAFTSSFCYVSNRWNARSSFSTPSSLTRNGDESLRLNGYRPPSSCPSRIEAGSAVPTHTPTPHHTSNVRLSLSLDGKAELVSSETSPLRFVAGRPAEDIKPPLAEPRPSSLQRSNSDQMPILPPISSITASLPAASSAIASLRAERARDRVRTHHLSRRSRDPLVWESCADPDSASVPRDELTTLAENESSGSAVAAITLLRNSSASASPRTTPHAAVLQPNGSKRNMAYQAGGSAQQNQHHQSKRVKLHRSQSSLGRLQNTAGSTAANDAKPSGKFTVAMMVSTNHNGGADSDKENWSPDEDGSVARRRNCASPVGLTNGWSRQANAATGVSSIGGLVDATTTNSSRMNASALLLPTGRQQRKAADQRPLQIFEDAAQPQQQEERRSPPVLSSTVPLADQVECFLRGGVISPSKRPDVDIVTGLLSLRHGN